MMRKAAALIVAAGLVSGPAPVPAAAADCARTSVGLTPLTELGAETYHGFEGGLYPGGSNPRPPEHEALGMTFARLAVPRAATGVPDPAGGTSVLLTIGMSNTRQESAALVQLAAGDALRHPQVVVVNGAQGGQAAEDVRSPTAPYWAFVDQQLAAAGVTPLQVQAVWLKQANRRPNAPFPEDALALESDLRAIVEILKVRFPNLWLAYLSSRIYAGYATTTLNPEPHAYQSGFAVKWLIEEQVRSGSVALPTPRPWLAWGPYLWADGLVPRADELTWACSDFAADGTHPSGAGAQKVAQQILEFLHTDPTAQVFYSAAGGL